MNAYLSLTFGLITLLFLSGCDHYSTHIDDEGTPDLTFNQSTFNQPETFKDYLIIEYYNLARYEQNQMYDYRAANHYLKKAQKLATGKMVSPDKIEGAKIPKVYKPQLKAARANLIAALKEYAIPQNRIALAIAQTRFDCWVDQAKEWPTNPEKLTCKSQFERNMEKLTLTQIEIIQDYNFDGV